MNKSVVAMANYNRWVNDRVYDLCADLTTEDYLQDRKIFFGSIHNTLNHILLVDMLWLARLQGDEASSIHSLDQILYHDFDELRSEHADHDNKVIEFTGALKADVLNKKIKYCRMNGRPGEETAHDILWTMFNHQTHHRGQVHAMLSQSGIKNSDLPDLDVVDFLAAQKSSGN